MLNAEQTVEFGRRINYYFHNPSQLPPNGAFVTVHQGQFPNFVDDVLRDVLNDVPFGPDNVQVNIEVPLADVEDDLNVGYEGAIRFREMDEDTLEVTLVIADWNSLAGYRLSIDANTGAVKLNDETRELPEGYELDLEDRTLGTPVRDREASTITITIPVYKYEDEDDAADVDGDYSTW